MSDPAVKEVAVELDTDAHGGARRRRRTGKRASRHSAESHTIEKESAPGTSAAPPKPETKPNPKPQQIILEHKKKPAKVMLVPSIALTSRKNKTAKKTFKARRIRLHVDNSAKTLKRHKQFHSRIDGMSDVQVREAIVAAGIAKSDTLAKAPAGLLRQMLRDYHTLRGGLL